MTGEEAIQYNKNLRAYMNITDKKSEYKFLEENYIALDMAIQALKQEPILDKIRAEICKTSAFYHGTELADGLDFAIKIVDKYKAESEDGR